MADRFAVNMIGVGFSGNENVYIGVVVKFNDYNSALMVVEPSDDYNDIVNTVLTDVKKMWDNASDINAFNHALNSYTKHRIMPFNIIQMLEEKSADAVYAKVQANTLKFFKNIETLKKEKTI